MSTETLQVSPLTAMQEQLHAAQAQAPSVERAAQLETTTNDVLAGIGVDLVPGADYTPSEEMGSLDYRAQMADNMATAATAYGLSAETPADTLGSIWDEMKADLVALQNAEDQSTVDQGHLRTMHALSTSLGRKVTDHRATNPYVPGS